MWIAIHMGAIPEQYRSNTVAPWGNRRRAGPVLNIEKGQPAWTTFTFAPVAVSAGQQLALALTVPA